MRSQDWFTRRSEPGHKAGALANGCYMLSALLTVGGFLAIGCALAGWTSWWLVPILWVSGVILVWIGNALGG